MNGVLVRVVEDIPYGRIMFKDDIIAQGLRPEEVAYPAGAVCNAVFINVFGVTVPLVETPDGKKSWALTNAMVEVLRA